MDMEFGSNTYLNPEECPDLIAKVNDRFNQLGIKGEWAFSHVQLRSTSNYGPDDIYVYGRIKTRSKLPFRTGPMLADGYRTFYISIEQGPVN